MPALAQTTVTLGHGHQLPAPPLAPLCCPEASVPIPTEGTRPGRHLVRHLAATQRPGKLCATTSSWQHGTHGAPAVHLRGTLSSCPINSLASPCPQQAPESTLKQHMELHTERIPLSLPRASQLCTWCSGALQLSRNHPAPPPLCPTNALGQRQDVPADGT